MKVKIETTVNIDPEAWTLDFGIEGTKEIREDVKTYCEGLLIEHLNNLGYLQQGA